MSFEVVSIYLVSAAIFDKSFSSTTQGGLTTTSGHPLWMLVTLLPRLVLTFVISFLTYTSERVLATLSFFELLGQAFTLG